MELVAGEVVCNARRGVRQTARVDVHKLSTIVDVLVPQILEQSVEVIRALSDPGSRLLKWLLFSSF